jgi:hypothetical protein
MSDAGTAPTDRQQKPWLFRPGVSGERRAAQALPLRRHRSPLPFRPSRRQGRRDGEERHRVSGGGRGRLPVLPHPRADRQRQLLHPRLCQGLRRARRAAPHHPALLAPHERHGRAVQRPGRERRARHHRLVPSGPRATAALSGCETSSAASAMRRASAMSVGPARPRGLGSASFRCALRRSATTWSGVLPPSTRWRRAL